MKTFYEASIQEDHECPELVAHFTNEEHAKRALGMFKAVHRDDVARVAYSIKPIQVFDSFAEYEKFLEDKTLKDLMEKLTDDERAALRKRFPGVL